MLRKGEADFLASWPSCFGLCIFAVSTGWDSSILWSSSRSSWSKLMPGVWSSRGQRGMPIVADVCGEMENWSWQFTSQYLFWNGLFQHTLVTLRLFPLLTIFETKLSNNPPLPPNYGISLARCWLSHKGAFILGWDKLPDQLLNSQGVRRRL